MPRKRMLRALLALALSACLMPMAGNAGAQSPRTERDRPVPDSDVTMAPTQVPTPTPKPTPRPTQPSLWDRTLALDKTKALLEEIPVNNATLAVKRLEFSRAHRDAQSRLDAIRRGVVTEEVVDKANGDLKEMKVQSAKIKETSDEMIKYQNLATEYLERREENTSTQWLAAIENQRDKQKELIRYIQDAIELVDRIGR